MISQLVKELKQAVSLMNTDFYSDWREKCLKNLVRIDLRNALLEEIIKAYAANNPCPGLILPDGHTTGCDQSIPGDCPTCIIVESLEDLEPPPEYVNPD